MIPVDWLEERSGLVGALKYFLFRKVPAETNWFHTLGSATLTAFIVQLVTGVVLAMYYKPDPENGVRVDPEHHERPDARLARPRHAPLGRERLHHPALPPHGPRVPVRRLQVPARAELADRRLHPAARHARGLHGLPAPVGPDGVLGDGRRDQHQRDRADRRAVHRLPLAQRRRDRNRHAIPLLHDAHAADPRRAHRAHHAAPVPRRSASGSRRRRGRTPRTADEPTEDGPAREGLVSPTPRGAVSNDRTGS